MEIDRYFFALFQFLALLIDSMKRNLIKSVKA